MGVRPPTWIQNGSYAADDDRLALQALLGGSPHQPLVSGIVGPNDLKVTQTGSPSMDLQIAAGTAWIVGTQALNEGVMGVTSDDDSDGVTIPTADATNPRIDLVVIQARNSEYSGADDDAILTVIEGTPSGSPTAPAPPVDTLVLAQIAVGAGVSSILTSHITDKRVTFVSANRIVSGHLATDYTTTGSLATFLTTPILSVGTWLVRFGGLVEAGAAGASGECAVKVIAGTATASFAGKLASEYREDAASGVYEDDIVLDAVVTVTAAGTLVFQAQSASSSKPTIKTATNSFGFPNATGFTALKIF